MRQLSIILAAAALSGCTLLGVVPSVLTAATNVAAAGDKVVINGTRALIVAHLAYQTAGQAALAARRAKLLDDERWENVQQIDRTVYAALQKGDAARDDFARAAAAAEALDGIAEIEVLLRR